MGGHGGLNILPHKSWNVYGAKQRARVARDEAAAREAREEAAKEALDASRAERLRALRGAATMTSASTIGANDAHVNLFAEEEAVARATGRTRDGREERGDAREDDGTRFGGRGVGRDARTPWYASGVREREDANDDAYASLPSRVRRRREEEEAIRATSDAKLKSKSRRLTPERDDEKRRERNDRHEKKRHREKKKYRRENDDLERLRSERLERERKESTREAALLNDGLETKYCAGYGHANKRGRR